MIFVIFIVVPFLILFLSEIMPVFFHCFISFISDYMYEKLLEEALEDNDLEEYGEFIEDY